VNVRILRNLGRDRPPYREGETRDLDDDEAAALVKAGLAEEVHEVLAANAEPDRPRRGRPPKAKPEGESDG
jgi:hypothetical protein